MTISEAIVALRTDLGMARMEELAVHVDASASTICRWEVGNRTPSRYRLVLLAKLARERRASKKIVKFFEKAAADAAKRVGSVAA